jgi:hypothetical protein
LALARRVAEEIPMVRLHAWKRSSSPLVPRAILGIAVLIGSLQPLRVDAARGTDGRVGYTWRDSGDGATPETATFDGAITTIAPADDAIPAGPIALPFTFPFYTQSYTSLWISDNGWIGFAGPYANAFPTPATIPTLGAPEAIIAGYWSQLVSNDVLFGLRIRHGSALAGQAYLVEVIAQETSSGLNVGWRVYLYRNGVIKIQYTLPPVAFDNATVGIEGGTPPDGCQIAGGGTRAPGVPSAIVADYVVEFEPPPVLPTECASIPTTACPATISTSLPGVLPSNAIRYGCSASNYEARERVYSFTLAQATLVDLTLTPGSGQNLGFFLLDACNERSCLRGPLTSLSDALAPGTYYVAVDAPLQADEGTFTLDLNCQPLGPPTSCGATVSGNTTGGPTIFASYPCTGGARDLSGNEAYYELVLPTTTNVRMTLSGLASDLDVLLLRADSGEITPADCVGWGDTTGIGWNVGPGRYVVVVDGPPGSAGPFTLALNCRIDLSCGALAGRVDLGANRVQTLAGDTTGGSNMVTQYACDSGTTYDGPERVYELDLAQPGQVVVFQTAGTDDLGFFVLDSCNEGACLGGEVGRGCGTMLAAGTHYLVVDGANGAAGPFEILVAYEEQFNRWSECERPCTVNCTGTTLITDTVSNFWNLDDGAFCIDNPGSYNFPDGCVFAMYAVVQCGTTFHIPLYDVEGGHIRVFDVFRGQYVSLIAQSPTWSMIGDDIHWQDEDCLEGSDPRWNEVVTDISFERPEGLCGLFRLEFPNHSGLIWELYANCAGTRAGQFNIHDSLCGALSEYAPLPNLTLLSASAVANCPNVTITYEVRNDGCGLARNVPVVLSADGAVVATDILPEAPYGVVTTRTFSAVYPGNATMVTLAMDPDDVILECTESGGIACDPTFGDEMLPLPDCILGACVVQADAITSPALICVGDAATIDGRGSGSSGCAGPLEYQLRDPGGIIAPWQASSVFTGIAPGQDTDYTLEARCASNITCSDSTTTTVNVELPPTFDPSTVVAADLSTCSLGIRINWGAAVFHGAGGGGSYNVYRSTVSCVDALDPASPTASRIGTGILGRSMDDVDTVDGGTYFYVVEAEDGSPAAACTLRGPVNNGTITRVEANGGSCQGITDIGTADPSLLPVVGSSLRMGGFIVGLGRRYGQSFVDLQYTPSRPLNVAGGEHYHVYRSESASSGFTRLLVEPPYLTAGAYRDGNADDTVGNVGLHVWHYLVVAADLCENDNLDLTPCTTPPCVRP